jgi:hypothetical protein
MKKTILIAAALAALSSSANAQFVRLTRDPGTVPSCAAVERLIIRTQQSETAGRPIIEQAVPVGGRSIIACRTTDGAWHLADGRPADGERVSLVGVAPVSEAVSRPGLDGATAVIGADNSLRHVTLHGAPQSPRHKTATITMLALADGRIVTHGDGDDVIALRESGATGDSVPDPAEPGAVIEATYRPVRVSGVPKVTVSEATAEEMAEAARPKKHIPGDQQKPLPATP